MRNQYSILVIINEYHNTNKLITHIKLNNILLVITKT